MLNSNFSVGDMNFNYRLKLETLSKHALASSMGLCNVQCKSLQSALKFLLSALFGIDWQAFSPSKHAVIIYWTLCLIICAGLHADCNARCNHKKPLVSQKGVQCSQSTDNSNTFNCWSSVATRHQTSNWVPYHTGTRSITTPSSWTGAKSMQNPPSPGTLVSISYPGERLHQRSVSP